MLIEDIKKEFDDKFFQHIHKGADAKKQDFGLLSGQPTLALEAPLTEDLDLNGNTIVGETLITGQTETTAIEDANKFIISDSSDSDNLKNIKRENLGEVYIVASTNKVFEDSAQRDTDIDYIIPHAGTYRVEFTLRKTDRDPGADDAESTIKVFDNCSNHLTACLEVGGASTVVSTSSTASISHDIFTYKMTKFRVALGNNTNIINFKILYTSSNSDGVKAN